MPARLPLAMALAILAGGCSSEPKRHAKPVASAEASAPPVPSASASAAPSASADAGPPAKPFVAPRVRRLDVPEEKKSPMPKVAEWTDTVRRSLIERPPYDCTYQTVREWYRVTCSCSNASASLVAGSGEGTSVWATEDSAQLIFPVRRGDARVFEIEPHAKWVAMQGPYGGMGQQEGGEPFVLSEFWLDGDEAPTFVAQ